MIQKHLSQGAFVGFGGAVADQSKNTSWRLTKQGWLFLLCIFLVLGSAYLLNHSMLFLLVALFSGTLIYDGLLIKFVFPNIHIDWEVPPQLFATVPSPLPIQIRQDNRLFPLRQLTLGFQCIGAKIKPLQILELKPNTTHEETALIQPSKRGKLQLKEVTISCSYPFGFWELKQTQPLDLSLWVFPSLLPQAPDHLIGSQVQQGTIPKNAQDFQYLANYQTGDDVRLIHWRKSALLENPVIRKDLRRQDAAKSKLLLADPSPKFELGLSALATLAVTSKTWTPWQLWTPKGTRPLADPYDLLMALATLQPLSQDELTKAESASTFESIRVSEIAEAIP